MSARYLLNWLMPCSPTIKTEYVVKRIPEHRLTIHEIPPMRAIDGAYTGKSLVNAYQQCTTELKQCNIDKRHIKGMQD